MFNFLVNNKVVIFSQFNKEINKYDYSVLIIDKLIDNDVVGCSQTRNKSIQNHSYFNPRDADMEFQRVINFFNNNNWSINYIGNRNQG